MHAPLFGCCCCCPLFGPPCDVSLLNGPSLPRSASPSRDATEFPMPSLYMFSAVDATSAVDYSRDMGIDDGVDNNPPTKLVTRAYAPSPSPLSKEKRTLVRLVHLCPLSLACTPPNPRCQTLNPKPPSIFRFPCFACACRELYERPSQTSLLVFPHSISTLLLLLVIWHSFAGAFPLDWCAALLDDVLG